MVQRAVGYLLNTFDHEELRWEIVSPAVEDAPHAPWWTYGESAGRGNRGRYSNAEFDKTLVEARQTMDDGKRRELLQKATEIAMTDLGVIPVFYLANTWAMKKGITYPGRSDGYTLAYEVRPE